MVAHIAMRHGINANLVHKWIRNSKKTASQVQTDFIGLPSPPLSCEKSKKITFTITTAQETITVEWPIDQAMQSARWLKETIRS